MNHTARALGALLLGCLGADCSEPEVPGGPAGSPLTAAILGGATTAGDPAVVALVATPVLCGDVAQVVCTGSVIAPRVVLTAAHCADLAAPATLSANLGPDPAHPAQQLAVVDSWVHPEYDGRHHDVALLLLSDAVQDVTPMPLTDVPVDIALGEVVRVVGYGADTALSSLLSAESDPTELPTKHAGLSSVVEFTATELTLAPSPGLTCTGDSGGPVLSQRTGSEPLIAITTGGDAACQRTSLNLRLDTEAASLLSVLNSTWSDQGARAPLTADADTCQRPCVHDADCPLRTVCRGPTDNKRCALAGIRAGRFGASCEASASTTTDCIAVSADVCRVHESCESTSTPSGCSVGDAPHSTLSETRPRYLWLTTGCLLWLARWARSRKLP